MQSSIQIDRQVLRKQLLEKRSHLSAEKQLQASQDLVPIALDIIEKQQAEHIAVYLPFKHEISPLVLVEELRKQGKKCYLPIIHPFSKGNLLFSHFESDTPLEKHPWGLLQPKLDVRNVIPTSQIDMIFTPLVGCDKQLGRLGYGGGFYDRTFEQNPKAIRIGLAHACQCVEKLPLEPWDKPLHHLIIAK